MVTVPAATFHVYFSRSQPSEFPSVTSAESGPSSWTVKWASSRFGQRLTRSGPKSVNSVITASGDRLVWTVNWVVGIVGLQVGGGSEELVAVRRGGARGREGDRGGGGPAGGEGVRRGGGPGGGGGAAAVGGPPPG